jgi:hypothetical protein
MVGRKHLRPFGRKNLSLYYGSDSARLAVLATIARALPPANIDIYLSPAIKTTLISGRNLPDISTVAGRAVTPSTREGVGWPPSTPPEMPTSWHYTLQALDPPIRLATFHAQPITRPCGPAESTLRLFTQPAAC